MAAEHLAPDLNWRSPPADLRLTDDQIHVWQASLLLSDDHLARLRSTLAADEQARAGRFHFTRDRDRYVAARGTLRTILGRYLGLLPQQVSFDYTPHGKPLLRQGLTPEGAGLSFNLSHSHDLALYVVARRRRVGVDVEFIRPELTDEPIAERFFSPREVIALRALPLAEQPPAFFRCWTRKEAFVKARGEGLSLPLDRFDVSLAPGEPAVLLATQDDPAEAQRWQLQALAPQTGYMAALAVEGRDWQAYGWFVPDNFYE